MKKKTVFLTLALVLVAFLIWWLHAVPLTQIQNSEITESNQIHTSTDKAHASPKATNFTSEKNPSVENAFPQTQANEPGKEEWRTPIEFYGKVEDENSNAISGADINFECNDLSESGTSPYHTMSDANGFFSITGIQGKLLAVKVNKAGYYPYLPHGNTFYYAGQNQNFVPDRANPIIYYLRRIGVAESLIHFHKSFNVPKDGTPVDVDLATGTLGSSSGTDFKIECWTDDQGKQPGQKYDWKCRVSLMGGGIQAYSEEFPFQAPVADYRENDEIDMVVTADQLWRNDAQREYFIRTADGRFGRLTFRMIAHGEHFCIVDSYFNPSGSRNLEPKSP
jgi:hypothetical protein